MQSVKWIFETHKLQIPHSIQLNPIQLKNLANQKIELRFYLHIK